MLNQEFDVSQDEELMNTAVTALPSEHLEHVAGWGDANSSVGYVYRPSTVAQLRDIFKMAEEKGRTIGLRGAGNSYGDPAMNSDEIVLDFTRMNRILDWNPENGRIKVEPGVTLKRVWEYSIEDGWWLPVATGTQKITVGGGAAMNVHGKNAWKMGVFGDHIYEFEMMLPSGEIVTCNREKNSDLFYATIGSFGMLGSFTSITLHLKRIYSGLINVEGLVKPNLHETMQYFEDHMHDSDYLVGWTDAFSKGKSVGRTEIHRGVYLRPGEDPTPAQTLRLTNQRIPPEILGFFPRISLWRFQRPFWNTFGMRFVNTGKFMAAKMKDGIQYQQPHAHFHFLLDSLEWRKAFGPGGLIQYQPFIPKENAEQAFTEIIELGQKRKNPNLLSVLKRYRTDNFLLSYTVDGYSLAMDFRITKRNRQAIANLAREMDEIVLKHNGRFYFAKDSTLHPETATSYLGEETISKFREMKKRCDPHNILQTNLWRRVFGNL